MSPSSKSFIEVIISQVKPGINVQNIAPGSHEAQVLSQMSSLLHSQPGCIRMYFGIHAENPNLFINCACWESAELSHAFMAKPAFGQFFGLCGQILDIETAPPVMLITNYTDVTKMALEAPVTEISFWTLKGDTSELRKQVLSAVAGIDENARTAGQAHGSVSDWVFEVRPPTAPAAPGTGETILCGLRGYDSSDSEQSISLKKGFEEFKGRGISLSPDTNVPGVNAETGSFQVHLQSWN